MQIATLGIALDSAALKRGEDAVDRFVRALERATGSIAKMAGDGDKAASGLAKTGTTATGAQSALKQHEAAVNRAKQSTDALERANRASATSLGGLFREYVVDPARSAMQKKAGNSGVEAGSVQNGVKDALTAFEDAIVDYSKTGKFSLPAAGKTALQSLGKSVGKVGLSQLAKGGVGLLDWLFPQQEGTSTPGAGSGGAQDQQGAAQAAQEAAAGSADVSAATTAEAGAGAGDSKTKKASINTFSGWLGDAQKGLEDYLGSAGGVAGAVESLFSDAFSKMGDAVATFATTGKLDFGEFAKSVIADLIKIQARAAISGLAKMGISLIGSLIGGEAASTDMAGTPVDMSMPVGTPIRASGGNVDAGQPYLIGERGRPELFVPDVAGRILPDTALPGPGDVSGAAPAITFHNTYNIDSRSDRADVIAAIQQSQQQTKAQILESINRGGQFSQRR
ncbi:hypothetical protein BKK81_23555 [Cupriavidus sp. USMAHM13]|uniref:phage tail tape measure C-terminal domain-containing protein n=1 Tax=Cupriavidus sp. USMAHM13 TaxID=1389192 RepID=UPI0008A6FF15|nr:phage tail tape measure C-terminal domain-containing protein [Cupriavidus sp. USMAHM13]AOZ02262.1 hypothetical protein BKK81_23555 [Cupriavidus sp. USMAHM13]